MNEKFLYWSSVLLGTLGLLFLAANISLISSNRALQTKVNTGQATINRGVGLSQINQALVQALADASLKSGNGEIRDLLMTQGISVKPADKTTADKSAAPEKDSKKK